MIGLIENSYIIGQGEDREIVFEIEDTQNVLTETDTILFAMADIDKNLKYSYSQLVENLPKENNIYTFVVTLNSQLTKSFDIKTYLFDITLIKGDEKIQLLKPKSLTIVKTIGASAEV